MQLLDFPTEILLAIGDQLTYLSDLNAFTRTGRFFYTLLNDRLYRRGCQIPPPLPLPRKFRRTILDWAAEHGKSDCVRRLLQAGFPHETLFPRATTPAPIPPEELIEAVQADFPPGPFSSLNDEGWHPIIEAAQCGHAEVVREFIEHGVDPNPATGFSICFGSRFGNPLTNAIKYGQESVVRLLLDLGVDLEFDSQIPDAQQPLSVAALYQQAPLAKLLLEKGCNPLKPDHGRENTLEDCAFSIAAMTDVKILKMFIDTGIDPQTVNIPNLWPNALATALRAGDMPRIEFLLDHVIGPNVEHDPEMIFDARFRGVGIYSYFSEAASSHPDVAQLLLQAINIDALLECDFLAPLCHLMEGAAAGGYEELMGRILAADLPSKYNIEPESWLGALDSYLDRAVKGGHLSIVKQLLDHGAHPNEVIMDDLQATGSVPILEAVYRADTKMVNLLLERGANPFPPEPRLSLNSVLLGAKSPEAKLEMVRLLLEKNMIVPDGQPPDDRVISAAVSGGEVIFDMVLQHLQVKLQPENQGHRKALNVAAELGEASILKRFLDVGFDPNSLDEEYHRGRRMNPLARAASGNRSGKSEEAVDVLLEGGADLEARDPLTDMTPLLMVADQSMQGMEILLRKDANPFCRCRNGHTPLVKAARRGRVDLVNTLLGFFEQQATPFAHIQEMVLQAARSARGREVGQRLWHYYWRRVYPCPEV